MRKALIGVAAGVVALVGVSVTVVAMQPAETHVERSLVVAATPADLWPLVSDFRQFPTWSPWQDMDPTQKSTFSDPATGVGAWYAWEGNDDVGSGKMTYTALEPEAKVTEDLEFITPFESKAVVVTSLVPVEGGTKVTWGFTSPNNFMAKAFGLFVDMDTMLGKDFEKGLGKLSEKAVVAAAARAEAEKRAAQAAAAEAAAPADPIATAAAPAMTTP